MRILFVIAALRNGGAERVLSAISSGFAKQNEVHIAVLEEDLGYYKFPSEVIFHYLKIYGKSKILNKFRKISALRSCFKNIAPDVIISFIDWTNVACVAANFGLGFKHIASEHHENGHLKALKFRFIRDFAYRNVDGLSVLTQNDIDYYKFVKNRVILHNPFFLKDSKGLAKENIILSVGRLEFVKGYDLYLKALAKIDKEILEGWEIKIAGEGSAGAELKNLADELGLNIKFLGHIEEIEPYYERSKIFVSSSRSEGLSNVLIEAANFDCARLSSDTVGGKELINDEVSGLLFKGENKEEMAKKLTRLIKDENLRQTLVENARKDLDKFRIDNVMQKWQNFVDKVVAK